MAAQRSLLRIPDFQRRANLSKYQIDRLIFVTAQNFFLGHFKEFLQESVPFGVGYMAAYMRDQGENVRIWDLNVRSRAANDIAEATPNDGEGTVFGISCLTAGASQAHQFAKLIKEIAPKSRIVYGGIHPTALPEEAIEVGSADVVVKAEGEETLKELFRRWREGEDIVGMAGIVCRDDTGKIIHGPPAPVLIDLNDFPAFPYDLFDLSKYHLGMVLTSRGCPFDCIFCSQQMVTGRRFRYRHEQSVVDELEFLIRDCGQPSIYFIDDMFNANPKRLHRLCKEIVARGLDKEAVFAAQVRADVLPPDILDAMKAANFKGLCFGIETGSEAVMARINKKEKVADILDTALRVKKQGFETEGAIIFGFPEETYEDRLKGVALAQRMGLTRVRFNNLSPYPGTPVFHTARASGELHIEEGWANFISAGATATKLGSGFRLPYVPEGTTNGALQGEVLIANLFSTVRDRLSNMITRERKPSGMGFELTFYQLLYPRKLYHLFMAFSTILLRLSWFLLTEAECRKFFFTVLFNRFPPMDPEVEEAFQRHTNPSDEDLELSDKEPNPALLLDGIAK
jgi:anaerobic magnesium-protoporphyrin IX monomethyl ester cyclase